MKKLFTMLLTMMLMAANLPASACIAAAPVALQDCGGLGKTSVTQNGDGNIAVIQSGDGNVAQSAVVANATTAVTVTQTVNAGAENHYHYNYVVVAPAEPEPEPEPASNWPAIEAAQNRIRIFNDAFIGVVGHRLTAAGWTNIIVPGIIKSHIVVNEVAAMSVSGTTTVVVTGYKLLYYSSNGEDYVVALTTAYHEGMRVADYPPSELIFDGQGEDEAFALLLEWLSGFNLTATASFTATTQAARCTCCANCSCAGACHPGCGCDCALDTPAEITATNTGE